MINFLDFPIGEHLDDICNTLKNSPTRFLVLTAETAAGKSTVLPLSLLLNFQGNILMSEPRRLAVLGVANRLAEELDEEAGETVGYRIHLENKVSNKTRLEVMTEGILVRNLQNDPALEKYNLIVLDEFHERSVNTDLALAFLKEAMELRDDLFVIIMSATMDTGKLVSYLGDETPVMEIKGRQFPVEVVYKEKWSVCDAVMQILRDSKEVCNILCFLPGIAEIRHCETELREILNNGDRVNLEIHILHSSISIDQQKKVLKDSPSRKIILSSAIAETSLTVPGVTVVIDSGLARVSRINLGTGMANLVTEVESEFSAEQRKGRAGRLQEGKCIRLWNEFDPRKKELQPEILRTDLSELVLECADRGVYNLSKIQWLDSPGKAAWETSVNLLKTLGLIKEDLRISEKGKCALKLGLHPRLASIILVGKISGCDWEKLVLEYSSYGESSGEIKNRFLQDLNHRLEKLNLSLLKKEIKELKDSKLLILEGYPDRLAKRIEEKEYQFTSGRKALIANDKYENAAWIVAPEVMAGTTEGKIFEYETLSESSVMLWLEGKTETEVISLFENGKVSRYERTCFGKIIISSKKLKAEAEDYKKAWCNEVKAKGLNSLPMGNKTISLILRAKFFNQQKNGSEFNVDLFEKDLCDKVEDWLLPFVNSEKLTEENVYDALFWFLKGDEINKEAPEIFRLTNGSKCKISYEIQNSPEDKNIQVIRPVIEIIIQRIFGCFETPEICGMKVLLKLLSPASRPLQITDDLKGFWSGAWIEICKEMKGRYPKHNWDYSKYIE